jgi:hypothetical protein
MLMSGSVAMDLLELDSLFFSNGTPLDLFLHLHGTI